MSLSIFLLISVMYWVKINLLSIFSPQVWNLSSLYSKSSLAYYQLTGEIFTSACVILTFRFSLLTVKLLLKKSLNSQATEMILHAISFWVSTQTPPLNAVEHLRSGWHCQWIPLPFHDHIKNTGRMKTDSQKCLR